MRLTRLLLLAIFALSPLVLHAQRERLPEKDLEIVEKTWPNAKRSPTSLRTVVLEEGSGEKAKPGDIVQVLYTGKLLDGTVFDQALDSQHPFTFRLGRGLVIDGWDEGLQQMRKGGHYILIVPYELGYGSRGDPPKIPREATLVFDVSLIGIKK